MNKIKGVYKQNKFFLIILTMQVLSVFLFIKHHKYDSPIYAIEQIKPCVVGINVKGIERKTTIWNPFFDSYLDTHKVDNLGSGVIISPDGYVITNYHVIENANDILVTLLGGKKYQGEIKGIDHLTDIALIKIHGNNDFSYAKLGNSDKLVVGEPVFALGNPLGLFDVSNQPTATAGIISGTDIDFGLKDQGYVYQDMIQTDAAINPGNSGGPLVNVYGEVIGINTFIMTDSDYASGSIGIGFSIPINRVRDVVKDIKKHGKVKRNYSTGIRVESINENTKKLLRLKNQKGVVIRDVEKDSPGYEAGLKVIDVILKVQNKNVTSSSDITRIIDEGFHKTGDIIKLIILRNNKTIEIDLELVDPKAEK